MHSQSDNLKIISNDKIDEAIEELLESILNRYQDNLEKLMRSSDFVFDYLHLFYYKCHKINPNCGGSYIYIYSADWIKDKKASKNNVNKKGNKCFQYVVTIVLNHEKIKRDPQRITKIKTFINKYNWEGINFPSEIDN